MDDNFGLVGHLNPDLSTLKTYSSTLLEYESMVLPRGQNIWFTDHAGFVVALDPAAAAGFTSAQVTAVNTTLTPGFCIDAGAGVTHTVSISTGTLSFTMGTITNTVENGMTHYHLPAGAYPYGLADVNGDLWFVDLNRQTVSILEAHRLVLPVG